MRTVVDLNTGSVLADRMQVAGSFWGRLLGLMGRRSMTTGEGLLLMRCRDVHTCFMRFAIDVAYLDRDMWVLAIHQDVKPWRFLAGVEHGEHTLELPAGAVDRLGVRVGHRLECREAG